jgi:hypothetical protein
MNDTIDMNGKKDKDAYSKGEMADLGFGDFFGIFWDLGIFLGFFRDLKSKKSAVSPLAYS